MKAFTPTNPIEKLLKVIMPIAVNGGVGWDTFNGYARTLTADKKGGVKVQFKDLSKNQDQPILALHPAICEYLNGESDRYNKKEFLSKTQLEEIADNESQWVRKPLHETHYATNKIKLTVTVPGQKAVSWIGTITANTVEDLFIWLECAMCGSLKSERNVKNFLKVRRRITKKMHLMMALSNAVSDVVADVATTAKIAAITLLAYLQKASKVLPEAAMNLFSEKYSEAQWAFNEFCY